MSTGVFGNIGDGEVFQVKGVQGRSLRQFSLVNCRVSFLTLQGSCEHQTQGQVNKAVSSE